VQLNVASGRLAPLTDRVEPGTAWTLATSSQTRIPKGELYAAEVSASGGPGVVVGRLVVAPSSNQAPQAGVANAIDGLSTRSPTGLWVVSPPGTQAAPVVSGAAPYSLALMNASDSGATYTVFTVSPMGTRTVATGTFAGGAVATVSPSALSTAGFDQIVVRSSAPVAATEDMTPTGNFGVVAMPGIPLAAPIPL
jgi:hypothetical protein